MSSYERSLEDNYEMLKKQLTAKQQQQQQQQQRHQPSPSPPPPLVRSASDSSGSKPESVVGIGREIKRITIEDERKKKLQEMLRKQQHHLQQQQHQARRAQYPLAVAAQQPSQKLSRIVSRNSSSASATTTMTGGVKSTGAKSVSSSSSSSLSQPPSLMSTPTLPAASRALVSSSSSSVSHLPPPDPSDMSNRIASLLEDNDKFVDKHRRKQLAAAAAVAAQKTSTHLSTFSSNTANITPSALMLSRIKSKRSESADSNDIQDDHHLLGSFRSQSSSTTTSSTRSLTPTRPPAILSSQPQHHHYQTTSGAASKLLLPSSSSFGSSSTSSIRSASSTTPTNRLMSSSSSHHHHHNHHQNHPHKVEHNYKFKRICSMALKLFGTYNTAGSSGGNSGGLAANEDEDKPVSSSSPSLASYSNDISNDVLMNVDMAAAALRYDYESMMAKAHSVAAAASSSSSRASSCAAEVRSSSDSVDQDDISRLARVKSLRKIAAAVNSGAAVVASQKLTTFQPQLPIQQTQSQQQKQLTPDMAARRIQAAFRQHLARRNPQFYSGCRPQQQQQQQQQQQEASIRRIQSINQCLTKLDMNTNQHHLKSKSLSIGLELCGSGAGGIENRPIGGGSIINRSLKPLAVIAKQQQQINAQITPVSTATIRTTASITTTRGSDYFLEDFHVEKLTSTATSGELKLPQQQQPSMVKFNASRFEYDEFAPVRKLSSSIRSKSESITASALSASATANANHMIASKSSGSSSTSSSSLSDMATAANLMMRRKTNRMSKLDSELAEMAVKAYSLTGINASSSTTSTTTATTSAKSNLDPHEALEAVVHLQAKLAPSKLAAAATASSSDENNLFKATAKSGTRVSAASYSSSSSSSSSNCSSASSTSSSSSSSSHSTLNEKEMNPESSEIVTPVLLAVENESKLKALRRHQTAPQSQQIARGVLLSESRRTMSNSSDPAQIQYTDDVVSGLEEFAASTTTTTTTPTKNGVSTNDLALDKSFRQLLLPSIEGHGKKSSSLQHRVVADALIASMNKELAAVAAADANEAINTACSSGSSTSTAAATAAAIGGFFEDDSFKKFMDELIHKFMREEETRNKHYAHMLKLREKALIQKTQAELACLEEFKLKAQEKCEDEKMLQILSKERTIKQKLRQEQENINKMKEAQRQASESRLAMILSQHHSELVRWCQNKLKQQQQSQQTDVRTETATTATTTTSTAANNEEEKMNESSSISNQSLNEAVRRNFKIHLNPERYLTVREKKLRMRRKQAEDIISWKKKLDDEEMKVREIEKKANSMLTTPTPVKAAVESVSSPVRVVQDQIKTDLNENNESEEAKTNLEKSGRTKELESKVRELQREMLKKKGEAEKLRQTLELKEKEDKMRKNRKSGSDSIVDRVDEENSSTTSVSITDIESSINSKPIVNESSPKVSQTETSDIQPSPALIEYEQSSNEVESGSKIEEKSVEEDINKDEVISSEIVIEESIKERYVYEEEEEEYDGKNSIIASQDSLAIQTTLMESSALSSSVKPISVGIHQDAEKISQLCNVLVANYYWKRLDRLKLLVVAQLEEDEMDVRDSLDFDADLREYFDEPIGLLFSSTTSSSRSSSPNNHEDEDVEDEMNFKLMLLHLVGELMLDLYSERFEQDEQDDELDLFVSSYHIKGQRKLHFKSVLKGPSRLEEAQKLISIKVADYLLKQPPKSATVAIASETSLHQHHIHDNSSSLTSVISTRSKWHQQRRLELFDTVLNRELREQEYEWSNYEAEEYETKMLVADAIFNSILHDTIDAFQISFIKKHT